MHTFHQAACSSHITIYGPSKINVANESCWGNALYNRMAFLERRRRRMGKPNKFHKGEITNYIGAAIHFSKNVFCGRTMRNSMII